MADVDLTKVHVNPSRSITFQPIGKRQAVVMEITNLCALPVAVKFKNTNPDYLKTLPPKGTVQSGQKMVFRCVFAGVKEKKFVPGNKDRFTVVLMALPKNANLEKVAQYAHKTATRKLRIGILWAGINDQKEGETQQQTGGNEEEDDKDRQGQMRSKQKSEAQPPATVTAKEPGPKKPTVMMFTRKEGDSLSDEEEDKTDGEGGAGGGGGTDEFKTTRPAGDFKGQVAPNAVPGEPVDDFKTTKPAGNFKDQQKLTPIGGGGSADQPKSDFKTTKPIGNMKGTVSPNVVSNGKGGEMKSELKTTKLAGEAKGSQVPIPVTPDMKTTKNAGSFENQKEANK